MIEKMIRKLLCWLGFHKWINLNKNGYPNLEKWESICVSDLHECRYCKKQEYLGMGCVS
jgi:hypothetical protein